MSYVPLLFLPKMICLCIHFLFPVKMLSGQATNLLRWSTGLAGSQGIAGRGQVLLDTQRARITYKGTVLCGYFPDTQPLVQTDIR